MVNGSLINPRKMGGCLSETLKSIEKAFISFSSDQGCVVITNYELRRFLSYELRLRKYREKLQITKIKNKNYGKILLPSLTYSSIFRRKREENI